MLPNLVRVCIVQTKRGTSKAAGPGTGPLPPGAIPLGAAPTGPGTRESQMPADWVAGGNPVLGLQRTLLLLCPHMLGGWGGRGTGRETEKGLWWHL